MTEEVKKCLGNCSECENQEDLSAKLYCATFQSVAQNKLLSQKIIDMTKKVEKLNAEVEKLYSLVDPHINDIGDDDVQAFHKMVEDQINEDAKAEDELE